MALTSSQVPPPEPDPETHREGSASQKGPGNAMMDEPLFDMAPERHYFGRDESPYPFCSDCRKPKPFMPYAGGTRPFSDRTEGENYMYELCEKCASESIQRAHRTRAA